MIGVAEGSRAESARDKILRKRREGIQMKERFFDLYAERIETLCEETRSAFDEAENLMSWETAATLATPFTSRWQPRRDLK